MLDRFVVGGDVVLVVCVGVGLLIVLHYRRLGFQRLYFSGRVRRISMLALSGSLGRPGRRAGREV